MFQHNKLKTIKAIFMALHMYNLLRYGKNNKQ